MVPTGIVTPHSIPPGHCVRLGIHQTDVFSRTPSSKIFAIPRIIFTMSRAPTDLFRTQHIPTTQAHRRTTSQTRLFHITFLHTNHPVHLCLTGSLAQRQQGTLKQILVPVSCFLRILQFCLVADEAPARSSMADYGSMNKNSSRASRNTMDSLTFINASGRKIVPHATFGSRAISPPSTHISKSGTEGGPGERNSRLIVVGPPAERRY